jgi:hypothetical protein
MICLDIEYPAGQEVKSDGEAILKLSPEQQKFMAEVLADNTIIGFEYIPHAPSLGILVQKKDVKPSILTK